MITRVYENIADIMGGIIGPSSVGGTVAYINSVQYVSITVSGATSATATITSVDTTKAVCIFLGNSYNQTSLNPAQSFARVELTNATTVTAFKNTSTNSITVNAVVVEFKSNFVQSIQQGTITLTGGGASSNTATITSVTTANAIVIHQGLISAETSNTRYANLSLTNATTVTADARQSLVSNMTIGYVVLEMKSGIVKSVQQVSQNDNTTNTSFTATLGTSVTTSNCLTIFGGWASTMSGAMNTNFMYYTQLTNSNTVTFTRTGTNAPDITINCTILEFNTGVLSSRQTGTITMASAASNTATVTAVDTNKAILNYGWWDQDSTTSNNPSVVMSRLTLTNTTTVTAAKNTAGTNTVIMPYELAQFN